MKFTNAQKASAKAHGKALLSLTCTGKHLGKADRLGEFEFWRIVDQKLAINIGLFAHDVARGAEPEQVFKKYS